MNRFAPLAFALPCWAVALYLLGLPLTKARESRGDFLYGFYSYQELYVGVPALLVALALTAFFLVPADNKRRFAGPLLAVPVAILVALLGFDLIYVFGVCGAGTANPWLDAGHVSRLSNVPDAELGFVRKPFTEWKGGMRGIERTVDYRTDGNGFRNGEGVERAEVVFVGDSYTEAAQVVDADTFVQRFGRQAGRSVVNLGRGAYGPQQELGVLERFGLGYEPRTVVWQFFDGNDLVDAEEYAAWRDDPAAGAASLRERYLANSFFRALLAGTVRPRPGSRTWVTFRARDGEQERRRLRYRWKPGQLDDRERGWAETTAALRAGAALCAERGIRLVVLFVPIHGRVYRERYAFASAADRQQYLPDDLVPPRDFGTGLRALCAELELPMVDLYDRFRVAARERDDVYIPLDEHLDVYGHELVADALLPVVQ